MTRGAEIMSKLEEVSSKRLILVDSFDAHMTHVLMLGFSLLISTVYASFLWFVCSTIPGIPSALLLFGSQIAMGFPASRAYYDLGVANRDNLQFIDPARFNGNGKHHEVDISLGEISYIFEKIGIQIQKYDKGSLDDLSDLVWFGIFVWAAFSSASFFLGISGYPLCLVGALVLLAACLASYLSGYWTRRNYGFEDDLSHLQYYVEKRFRDLDVQIPNNSARFYVLVLERWRSMVVIDFRLKIGLGRNMTVEYHIGFPSSHPEHFLVNGEKDVLQRLNEDLLKVPLIAESGWNSEVVETPFGHVGKIVNGASEFSVDRRSSFVKSPSMIDQTSGVTADVLSKVLSLLL
jgi:hypothetical protein